MNEMVSQAQTTAVDRTPPIIKLLGNPDAVERIRNALPAHMSAERFTRMALNLISKNRDLLNCDRDALFLALLNVAGIGLDPDNGLGLAYILPHRNGKTGKTDPTIIIGYRGMLELARRSDKVLSIHAFEVRENDPFKIILGMHPEIQHSIDWTKPRGNVIGFYAVAEIRDGSPQMAIMQLDEVTAIKNRSKSGGSSYSPWATDFVEMGKKTVLRRLFKLLPASTEIVRQINEIESDIDFQDHEPRNPRVSAFAGLEPQDEQAEQPQDIDPLTGEIINQGENNAALS